jgi:hypothetical protein
MNKIEFEEKYRKLGGFEVLKEFMANDYTLEFIGNHFGVTKQAVKLWCVDLFGENYDPRQHRKEKILESMIEFAKKHTEKEFNEAYYYVSKYYYDLALMECRFRKIYES